MLHVDTESNSMKWIQSHQECISCNWNMYIPQLVDDLLQHTGGGIIQNEILKRAYSSIRLFICYDLNDFFYYTLKIQNCNHHFKCDLSIRLDFYFNLSFSLFPTKWFLDIFFGTHIIFHIFQNLMILPIPQRKGSLWLTTQTRHVNRYNSQQRTIQLKL